MTQYKNALISIGCYILSILLIYVIPLLTLSWSPELASKPSITGKIFLVIAVTSLLTGLLFSYKSIKGDKNKMIGRITALIGLLILLFPIYGIQLIFLVDRLFVN